MNNMCETMVGNALSKYPRNLYKIAGKFSYLTFLNKKTSLEQYFQEQLNRNQIDYFDFYLIQKIDRRFFVDNQLTEEFKSILNFLLLQKKNNKIKNLGFSFHDTPLYLDITLKYSNWDFVQLPINYYDWYEGYGKILYNLCYDYNLPIIAMSPLKGGILGDKNNLDYKLAYKFLNTLSLIKVILNGTCNLDQYQNNINIISKNEKITYEELDNIKQNLKIIKKYDKINCTECNYCIDKCVNGIDIKKTFSLYNTINNNNLKNYIDYIKEDKYSPLNCKFCHKCEQFCPQHLPIANLMKEKILNFSRV